MSAVYEQLYDIVESRMTEQHKEMPCSKKAFLYAVRTELGKCSIDEMQGLNSTECLEAAFVGIFGRLPDTGARKAFAIDNEQDINAFQSTLISTLINSAEAVIKNGAVIENKSIEIHFHNQDIYRNVLNSDKGENNSADMRKAGIKDKLYTLYLRMPASFQRVLRKVLRRDK